MDQNQGEINVAQGGARPKSNKQSLQAKKIVKTVLAKKSMDEQCALMDAMEQRQLFRETEIAQLQRHVVEHIRLAW